jgi:hypothetical protein
MIRRVLILAICVFSLTGHYAAGAAMWNCHRPDEFTCCQWEAHCYGDFFWETTPCQIQCFVYGTGGEIVPSGSAGCGAPVYCPV